MKKTYISGHFWQFLWKCHLHLQKSTLFSWNRMEGKTFVWQTLKVIFLVCVPRWDASKEGMKLRFIVFYWAVWRVQWSFASTRSFEKQQKCDIKRLLRRPQLVRVVRRFSVRWSFCHGVTSATSVWSGSCAVYASDGIFGAAPWLHQVPGVIRSAFVDSSLWSNSDMRLNDFHTTKWLKKIRQISMEHFS